MGSVSESRRGWSSWRSWFNLEIALALVAASPDMLKMPSSEQEFMPLGQDRRCCTRFPASMTYVGGIGKPMKISEDGAIDGIDFDRQEKHGAWGKVKRGQRWSAML